MKFLDRFIYKGWYYPVIGSSNGWTNNRTKQIIEYRIGGWKNADKWWSFSIGVKCRVPDNLNIYKDFVYDKILNNPELEIRQEYFNDCGEKLDKFEENCTSMISVYIKKTDLYVGNITDAYYLSDFSNFESTSGKVINVGYDEKNKIMYGWSHRSIQGFKIGDQIFSELDYNNYPYPEDTPFTQHGYSQIRNYRDQLQAAKNFANYIG